MSKNLIDTPAEMAALPKTGNKFIDSFADEAINAQILTGVPASVTLAQAFIESGQGKHAPRFNFFGIKGKGTAGSQMLMTTEFIKGKKVRVKQPFRAYRNAMESFVDHGQLFLRVKAYSKALKFLNDAKRFVQIIGPIYATAPNYATTVNGLIDRFKLLQFDEVAKSAMQQTQDERQADKEASK